MKIEIETIQKMAHLSRLELKPEEEITLAAEAEKILDWMNQLNEIDTSDVEPLLHMHNNSNVFREDVTIHTITKEEGLFNAPQKTKDYFTVPKVIES
jgi:aspartyl-tRNA(Asn)/glutamyl-tRNA(Gln) amidotransferase subunit C